MGEIVIKEQIKQICSQIPDLEEIRWHQGVVDTSNGLEFRVFFEGYAFYHKDEWLHTWEFSGHTEACEALETLLDTSKELLSEFGGDVQITYNVKLNTFKTTDYTIDNLD